MWLLSTWYIYMAVETEELSILINWNLNLKTKEVLIFYVDDMLKLWYVGYAGLINRLLKLISTVFFKLHMWVILYFC